MKRQIALLLVVAFCHSDQAGEAKSPLMASSSFVWAGLDYSMVRVIGGANDIKAPELLFQDMPRKWNDLFLDERIEGIATSLNKRAFIDIGGATERNATVLTNKSIFAPDTTDALEKTYITQQDISAAISSYKMEHRNGLGLVFIVDSMIYHRNPQTPANRAHPNGFAPVAWAEGVNAVFFDIATREIHSARREVNTTSASGSFRNFWFGPIKDADSGLYRYR
jgi:hypothetical protein